MHLAPRYCIFIVTNVVGELQGYCFLEIAHDCTVVFIFLFYPSLRSPFDVSMFRPHISCDAGPKSVPCGACGGSSTGSSPRGRGKNQLPSWWFRFIHGDIHDIIPWTATDGQKTPPGSNSKFALAQRHQVVRTVPRLEVQEVIREVPKLEALHGKIQTSGKSVQVQGEGAILLVVVAVA